MTAMCRCLKETRKGRPVLVPVCIVYGFGVSHTPSRKAVPGLDALFEERATIAAEMIVRPRILHGYIDSGSSPISWAPLLIDSGSSYEPILAGEL